MRRRSVSALVANVAALSLAAAPRGAAEQTFKAAIDLVRADIAVTRGGQPVRGLTAADFSVHDSGVAQRVNSVTLIEDLPVSVLLVLDTSGSVRGERLQHLVAASHGLLENLRSGDRAGLITFSDRVTVQAALGAPRQTIADRLSSLIGKNTTALNDAVWTALQLSPVADETRPLVLVFSDGVDTASWLTQSALVEAARRAGVVIHAVELENDVTYSTRGGRVVPPPSALQRAAKESGGRKWSATSSRDLQSLFTKAIDEMRARYLLTFYPEGVPKPGWHPLKIGARGRGDVIARPGYFKGTAQ